MRSLVAGALVIGLAVTMSAQSAEAGRYARSSRGSDCTPTNGPFGFYGNLWCQPTDAQYLRNLGAQWPQKTPPGLRYPKPSAYWGYTW